MNKIRMNLALSFFIFLLLTPIAANATSCAFPEEPIKQYDVAFKGKALGLSKESAIENGKQVEKTYTTFEVIKEYKGKLPKQLKIYHSTDGMFGTKYKDDTTYVIYTSLDEDGRYTSGTCSSRYQFVEEGKVNYQSRLPWLNAEEYKAKADALDNLVSEYPKETYLLVKKAEFHEEYNDFQIAADTYKKAINVVFEEKYKNDARANMPHASEKRKKQIEEYGYYVDFADQTYLTGYGRNIYKMGKYAEVIKHLEGIRNDEGRKYYQASILKLGNLEKLNGQKVDFSGLEFKEIDLSGLDLSGSNFSDAKFYKVKMHDSKFDNVNFSGAEMRQPEMKNSSFTNSDFKKVKITHANIEDTDFTNADFKDAFFAYSIGKNVDFTNSNFQGAKFFFKEYENINLSNADFTNALPHRLDGMKLEGTKLNKIQRAEFGEDSSYEGVDLSGFDLSESDLRGVNLKNVKFVNTDLSGANLTWSHDGPTNLQGADMTGANLNNTLMFFAYYDCKTKFPDGFKPETRYMLPIWENCKTERPDIFLSGLTLPLDENYNRLPIHDRKTWGEAPWLQNVDLHGIDLQGSNLGKFECTNCNLRDANFSGVKIMLRADKSDLRGANFKGAEIIGRGSNLNEADVRGVDLSGIKLQLKRTDKQGRKYYLPLMGNIKYDNKTVWPEGFTPASTDKTKSE
ncbi:MAG: pentapeptide repeat-containing protein [Rhodospirillales bacterium]|nr:pentapeptide repeat-containing protein [Rhodospirillales bacterium]